MHNGTTVSTIRLRFVEDSGYSPDGHTQVRCDVGEIHDVPHGIARSLVAGGNAVPIDPNTPDDFPPFGGEETQRADAVLRKHDLNVTSPVGTEDVRRLERKHRELGAQLDDALDRLHAAERDAADLEHERREARIEELTGEGGGEGPGEDAVEDATRAVEDACEDVDAIREALDRIGERMVQALDEAKERATEDVDKAHRALLRKCIDAGRKFDARLDDLKAFEDAHKQRIDGPPVGDMGGNVENWIDAAAERT